MTDDGAWAAPGSALPATPPSAAPATEAGVPPEQPISPTPRTPPETPEEIREFEAEIPFRPLGVSELLDGAITYVRRSPRAALGLSAILTSVVQIAVTVAEYFLIGGQARTEITPGYLMRSVGPASVAFVGGLLLTAHIVLLLAGLLAPVMGRTLLGRSTSFGQAWRYALPRLARLVGSASVLIGLLLIAVAVPIAPLVAAVSLDAPTALQAITAILGVPLAVVLMVVCYVWFALSTPILVLERRGVLASLRRSAEMVRGRWWRTFGVLALALVITVFVEFLVLPVPFAVAQRIMLTFDGEPSGGLLVAVLAIGTVGHIIAGAIVNPFNAGVITLLYADRRMRREAFDLELRTRPATDPVTAWLPSPLTAAGSGPQPRTPRHAFAPYPPPPAPYPPPPPWGWQR